MRYGNCVWMIRNEWQLSFELGANQTGYYVPILVGELIYQLLLHCMFPKDIWSLLLLFAIFGVKWVIPPKVVAVFLCQQGMIGREKLCNYMHLWIGWIERNNHSFNCIELSTLEWNPYFFINLYEWSNAIGIISSFPF